MRPAIITADHSDRLRALLSGRTGTPRDRARTYLLSGILRCAVCGKGLCGRNHAAGRRYICPKQPGSTACGTVFIMADNAESEVTDRVLAALDSPETLARLLATAGGQEGTNPNDISDRLRDIDEQRGELAALWAAKEIDRKEWLRAGAELRDEADTLTAQLARTQRSRALADFAALEGGLWERWDHLTPGIQRALIAAVVDHIDVRPARTRHWDPDRIADPIWRA
jgi:site-specific DNA recombinase